MGEVFRCKYLCKILRYINARQRAFSVGEEQMTWLVDIGQPLSPGAG